MLLRLYNKIMNNKPSNEKIESSEMIRRRIIQNNFIREQNKMRKKIISNKTKFEKKNRKRNLDQDLPKSKISRKSIENLIVKSPIQKEFSFHVSSRSSNDTYMVIIRVNNGELKLECNCGSKFRMIEPRSNCIHCISALTNLFGNTISSVKNKKRLNALDKVHQELINTMEES